MLIYASAFGAQPHFTHLLRVDEMRYFTPGRRWRMLPPNSYREPSSRVFQAITGVREPEPPAACALTLICTAPADA